MKKQKVAVIGLGYVGLPLAIAIEKTGKYDLIGVDRNTDKVTKIQEKISPLEDELVKSELKKYPIKATTEEAQLSGTDIFIIAVPTPVLDDHTPDYGPVIGATTTVSKYLQKGGTIILESTVNPGTCEEIMLPIIEKISKLKGVRDFNLVHCPERINPGDPKWTVYNIPRNIGSLDQKRNKEIADFYRSFLDTEVNEVPSLKIAEATKIIENTFRDINIAYVNELAKSFDAMEIDLYETIKASSNKPFGYMPHWPGAGVGGHCIAVDPYYLIKRAEQSNFDHKLLKEARRVNNSMPEYAVDRLEQGLAELKKSIKGSEIALLGLTYKGDVADLRESPALEILEILENRGAEVIKFDPYMPSHSSVKSLDKALDKADAVLLATAHKSFKNITASELKKYGIKIVVDGRNILDKNAIIKAGIIYKGIGR